MYIKSLFYKLKANPKKVFLLDASGALISLVSFLCILNPFIEYFGMPSNVLYKLSAIAVFLFIYSFSCSKLIKSNWRPFLKIIILFNSLYIIFSIGLIFYHFNELTILGVAYFILEIVIILLILLIELKSYKALKK